MELTTKQFIADYESAAIHLYAADLASLSPQQQYQALAFVVRGYYATDWANSKQRNVQEGKKQVYYFAIEFLPGRLLGSNLLNMGILDTVEKGLTELGLSPAELYGQEADPGLGNGGLGRLGSAFLDAMASTGMAGNGNSIRYEYGLFQQRFVDGWQVELPDDWLRNPFAWETRKENRAVLVKFGGSVVLTPQPDGRLVPVYHDTDDVLAVPYDVGIVGYGTGEVNTMRLWSAELPPGDERQFTLADKARINAITQILYPDDSNAEGRELRLRQEYFFVSAGVQSIIRYFKQEHANIHALPQYVAIHINDTHPAMAVAELMRVLLDEEHLDWDSAWRLTVQTLSYTNHTLLAEALETWPEDMFAAIVPRLAQIVGEIDRRFRARYTRQYGELLVNRTAPIGDGNVRMAYLAVIGSHAVNGVAELHTQLLENSVLRDLYTLFPHRFSNKTNGITPRRWVQLGNRPLAGLLDQTIGTGWRHDPAALLKLHDHATDTAFLNGLKAAKHANKEALAAYIEQDMGLTVNPDAIFDVQVKRLHAYKRQLLHVFGILEAYNALKNGEDRPARLHIFGAKAAPSYSYAKSVIKLINEVANVVNNDPAVNQKLQVAFMPNYGVSLAEKIVPAADISEQISLAGLEASGTSNMKLMASGALTLATLDGANIEIAEAVGRDNIEIFGLTEKEVAGYHERGDYSAQNVVNNDPRLQEILSMLVDGRIPNLDGAGKDIYESLLTYNDDYFVLADFDAYVAASRRLDARYQDPVAWGQAVTANIAASGRFDADYTVVRYGREIWHVEPTDPREP